MPLTVHSMDLLYTFTNLVFGAKDRIMKRILLLACFLSAASLAQNSATVYGTVSDAGGAVVPGVGVTVTHVETGTSRKTATDGTGGYVFVQLPVGHFTLQAQSP